MASVRSDLRLAYDDEGNGIPVVLLPGLTFDRTTWRPAIERLRAVPERSDHGPWRPIDPLWDGLRTIAIDLPGHGESGGGPRPLPQVAQLVHDLLTELGVEAPVVVGHSMSATIATHYAAAFPALGVVNVDQLLDVRPFAQQLRRIEPELTGPEFPQAFEPFQRGMGLDQLAPPLRATVLAHQTISRDLVVGYWDGPLHADPGQLETAMTETMRRVRCPYLAVFGRTLTPEQRTYMTDRLVDLQIEEWPGGGHFVHLADVDRFVERLRSFVRLCCSSTTSDAHGDRARNRGQRLGMTGRKQDAGGGHLTQDGAGGATQTVRTAQRPDGRKPR